MKYSLRFHLHFDGKEIFGIIDWNRSGMIRNAILLLMNWISIHLQCVFMSFLLLFWRKSFVIQSFANGSLCSLHLIYFSINLCARFKSEYIQFEKLPFKREKVDQTELTNYVYICMSMCFVLNCVSFCVNAQKWNLLMVSTCLFVGQMDERSVRQKALTPK